MSDSYRKDLEALIRRAARQGWRYRRTERGHYQFYAPNGKDIVTTSGTPGDIRAWSNFMKDMKRAGYDPSPQGQSMADQLAEAMRGTQDDDDVPPPINTPAPAATPTDPPAPRTAYGAVVAAIRDKFAVSNGRILTTREVVESVKVRLPDASEHTINSNINRMHEQGEIVRVAVGQYKSRPTVNLHVDPVPPAPSFPAVYAATEVAEDATDDERELDEALAALAKIEAVVRKHRGIARQLKELKRLLGNIGG